MPSTVTLSSKNQIVVPREARERMSLRPGQQLLVLCREDRIVLIPRPDDFVGHMTGLHKEVWQDLGADEHLSRERDGWKPD